MKTRLPRRGHGQVCDIGWLTVFASVVFRC